MDKKRRKFLKILFFGGVAFVAGRIFGPLFSKSANSANRELPPKRSSFKIVENQKILSIYDSGGEEIFQIDKSA